jgi:thiamine pyrophosphate-dependent acetolactate synthase large subunit-like protein
MTVADLVVGQLLGAGVKALFGVPGGGNLDLIAAAGKTGLPFVLTSTGSPAVALAKVGCRRQSGVPLASGSSSTSRSGGSMSPVLA